MALWTQIKKEGYPKVVDWDKQIENSKEAVSTMIHSTKEGAWIETQALLIKNALTKFTPELKYQGLEVPKDVSLGHYRAWVKALKKIGDSSQKDGSDLAVDVQDWKWVKPNAYGWAWSMELGIYRSTTHWSMGLGEPATALANVPRERGKWSTISTKHIAWEALLHACNSRAFVSQESETSLSLGLPRNHSGPKNLLKSKQAEIWLEEWPEIFQGLTSHDIYRPKGFGHVEPPHQVIQVSLFDCLTFLGLKDANPLVHWLARKGVNPHLKGSIANHLYQDDQDYWSYSKQLFDSTMMKEHLEANLRSEQSSSNQVVHHKKRL